MEQKYHIELGYVDFDIPVKMSQWIFNVGWCKERYIYFGFKHTVHKSAKHVLSGTEMIPH